LWVPNTEYTTSVQVQQYCVFVLAGMAVRPGPEVRSAWAVYKLGVLAGSGVLQASRKCACWTIGRFGTDRQERAFGRVDHVANTRRTARCFALLLALPQLMGCAWQIFVNSRRLESWGEITSGW
jgi:hypothetical protein